MQHPVTPVRIDNLKSFLSHCLTSGGEETWDFRALGWKWAGFLQDPWSWVA